MLKVAIVDDKRLNRTSLSDELTHSGEIKVLFTAQNGAEFLEKMKEQHELPEIVLMDIDMPEKNGIETVSLGKVAYPSVEYIMLTVYDDSDKIFEAVKAGASGYLLKDESSTSIISFLKQVKEFRFVPMSPSVARKALKMLSGAEPPVKPSAEDSNLISTKEKEVLKGLVDGYDYKEIADRLSISPNTVRNHIAKIYSKLHVTNKVDAVKIAINRKMVGD